MISKRDVLALVGPVTYIYLGFKCEMIPFEVFSAITGNVKKKQNKKVIVDGQEVTAGSDR